ncbi:MAG: A/G-specific adenine glycosylase [Chthoniobacterales bacterium]
MSVDKLRLQRNLREWYLANARDLPWRRTEDPYAILISEYMLQQTQVVTVIPYYARWMKRFPGVCALAKAEEQDVLSLWQGLGYYARARNLRKAAQAVVANYKGVFPESLEELRSLPGVGEYTAAAVAAFAYDQAVPVVDANIARVLARIFNYRGRIDETAGKNFLRNAAISLLPKKGGRIYNSALMELGALICTARKPKCEICPVKKQCHAIDAESLPLKKKRTLAVATTERCGWIWKNEKLWLQQSQESRWKGLWHLPPLKAVMKSPLYESSFSIMHYQVKLLVFGAKSAKKDTLKGFSTHELINLPMPSPHRRAVAALLQNVHSKRNANAKH